MTVLSSTQTHFLSSELQSSPSPLLAPVSLYIEKSKQFASPGPSDSVFTSFFSFPSLLFPLPLPLPLPYSHISKGQRPHQKRKVRRQTWTLPNKKTPRTPLGTRCDGRPAHHADEMLIVTPVITRSLPREPNLHTRRDTRARSRWRRIRRDVHLMKSLITLR